MAERNFDSTTKQKKGHKFTLAGRQFRTHAVMPLNFLMGLDADEEVKKEEALSRTLTFIRSMLVEEDREKWDAMLLDSNVYISYEVLIDLFQWLIEVASGRPTTRPSSSGNGAGQTASSSKATSSAKRGSGSKTSTAKKPSPSATPTSAK